MKGGYSYINSKRKSKKSKKSKSSKSINIIRGKGKNRKTKRIRNHIT